MPFPEIRSIQTIDELRNVQNAATADGDNMRFPTHGVYKEGQIIGGLCLNGIPLALAWMSKEHAKARDSLFVQHAVDAMMDQQSAKSYLMACNSHSPFYLHMEKFGYKPVWPTNMFVKQLRK